MVRLTCQIRIFATLRRLSGRLDELLEPLVVDVRGGPFWDLIPREVVAELHVCQQQSIRAEVGKSKENR